MLDDILKLIMLYNLPYDFNSLLIKLKCDIEGYSSNTYHFVDDVIENITIGDIIGEGAHRICYNFYGIDDYVIKKQKYHNKTLIKKAKYQKYYEMPSFCTNLSEFLLWCMIKGTKYEKYFTPCVAISKNLQFIIMKKVNIINNLTDHSNTHNDIIQFCNKIEYFDLHMKNFGLLNGNLVLCDYAIPIPFDQALIDKINNAIINEIV